MTTFLTLPEICARYSVVPITVRRWIAAGNFVKPIRLNGRRYFSTEEVLAWEAKRRV